MIMQYMYKSIGESRRLKLVLISLFALTILTSCGGGGGGGGTTDPETVFQLYPPGWGEGYTENYNVTGTVKLNSVEAAASGTYELEIGDLALPDACVGVGVDTYSVSASIDLEFLAGRITSTGVIWYDSSNDSPLCIQVSASVTGIAPQTKTGTPFDDDISILPAVAQVGDSGTLTSWIFSNGTEQFSNWSLDPSTDGNALLITESATYEGNTPTTSVYQEEKINEDGERLSIYHEVVDPEIGLEITIKWEAGAN